MYAIWEFFDSIGLFMDAGGTVLWLIAITTVTLWSLIMDRFLYLRQSYPGHVKRVVDEWNSRLERKSWNAHKIRDFRMSQLSMALNKNVSMIKVLVALCPLLGLLGTVTGMIHVFDVMAVTGSSNARSMASGISMATLPTMAGMVAALSGLYLGNWLENLAKSKKQELGQLLALR